MTFPIATTAQLSDDESSISSAASLDVELQQTPTLKFISVTNRLSLERDTGELIDTGGNFCMCNDLNMLVNVFSITPFGILIAATQQKSNPTCTHRGDFPIIPMVDGSIYYTPMHYSPTALDCILSPHAICTNSKGYLTRWTQEGQTSPPSCSVVFYNKHNKPAIKLDHQHRNGLFYTTTEATAIDHSGEDIDCSSNRTGKRIGLEEEALLDETSIHNRIDMPTNNPRRLQLEADLWQARLGHCGEWQLKAILQAVNGTPSQFQPHLFSTYNHYNRARIRKMPATKGKHPTRATDKQQRFYMDFGFLRASNFDYSKHDKSEDCIVRSFDGYNSYLLIVDEYTKFIWVFLCTSKEPPNK
jgi:hypothetical protein